MTHSQDLNKPAADPLIGKRVAQYDIVAKLGGGGMGVVYTARDTKLGRLVALKFLPPQWSHDETAKQRFIREAQAASATDHQNICTIHNIETTDDGQLFIVMAHYEGETLKQRLERGALAVEEALEIAAQVAEGLAKAHAQGVVHRDIKPGNLMITDDSVKILDFGLAKFADSLQLTIVGSTLGTVGYMSPEQTRGEEADVRSDIWALGVVLYEMLTGQVPFKGAYAEAISYAIRNDPPPPLKSGSGEIPEAVERLVLRALEKDPAARFQSAREFARDLRLIQGRSIPIELRTEALPALPRSDRRESRSWRRLATAAAAPLGAAIVAGYIWLTWPVDRIPVVIAPVANQTGYTELDAYRLALTQALTDELSDSGYIRVLPYARLVQILRQFFLNGSDASSREALQALTTHSGAQTVIVPTLVYENGAWRARAEFRSAETATNVGVYDTNPVVSSLVKDTAYGLMSALRGGIHEHFRSTAPARSRIRDAIRDLLGYKSAASSSRMRSLDAAAAFEQGVSAYEQLEYASARRSFEEATRQDPRSPLALAWLSRVSQLLRQNEAAARAADDANRLMTIQTTDIDQLFVAAVSAEGRRDFIGAEERYRDLTARYPDEAEWLIELAAFQDRRTQTNDAIATYRQALRLDSRLARPHLELCRLYNRLNEPTSANEEGQKARSAYRALGNRGGEAQALMCLTDMLRLGNDKQRAEARQNAEAALNIFQDLRYPYNLARAQYYVALAVEAQGQSTDAVRLWEESLATARSAGNVVLEPIVLMNLGAMYERLGNHSRALEQYRQSHALFEKFGEELRAAQNQLNIGSILIEYAGKPAEGLRDVQNALGVFQKLGDKTFEVLATKIAAASHRYAGRHEDAERELNRGIALARQRDMQREIPALTIDLALSRFEMGDYAAARNSLLQALGDGSGKDSPYVRLHLGLTEVRLGQFAAAETELRMASEEAAHRADIGFLASLHDAMGQLRYESGDWNDARIHFSKAAGLWTDELPEPASVEARAYLGLLDALEGNPARGRIAVQSSLEHASKTGPLSLEARCRVYLARIDVTQRRFEDALRTLDAMGASNGRSLGSEIEAQVRHWRSRALVGRGDQAAARSEKQIGRKLMQDLRESLPEQHRNSFASRPDIRLVLE